MKTLIALLIVSLAPSAFAASATLQALRAASPRFESLIPDASPQPAGVIELLDPHARPLPSSQSVGAIVGQVSLPALLDRHRDAVSNQRLGDKPWDISIAGDAAFKNLFFTFQRPGVLSVAPIGDLNRLRGEEGVNATIEPGVVYNFRMLIDIFSPIRGSTLLIHPVAGTNGPAHDINTGVVFDALKAKAYVFSADNFEYVLLHGTDIDPSTNRPASTRSLLFIHENGMSTQAWPLAESALPANSPVKVTFGDEDFILTRSANGDLSIAQPD